MVQEAVRVFNSKEIDLKPGDLRVIQCLTRENIRSEIIRLARKIVLDLDGYFGQDVSILALPMLGFGEASKVGHQPGRISIFVQSSSG